MCLPNAKNMTSDVVYVGMTVNTAWIKIVGRGTFQNSHPIKKWLLQKLDQGCLNVFVDLSECASMDSTCMGILTGISLRMHGRLHKYLQVINPSAHNIRLLETLGLNRFVEIKEKYAIDENVKLDKLQPESLDKLGTTKHIVDAHQDLMDTGGTAYEQFKGVHKMLKEDLERQLKKDK